jgi:hypothetical protein
MWGSQGPQRTGPATAIGVSLGVHSLGELLFPFLGQNESLKSLPCHTPKVTTGLSREETLVDSKERRKQCFKWTLTSNIILRLGCERETLLREDLFLRSKPGTGTPM